MGIFNKKDDLQELTEQAEELAITSIIDETMSIEGEMTFNEKTKIDGSITGNIQGEHLVLSDRGKVTGDIVATSFNCFGTFNGNVKAKILIARKGCHIRGKIEATSLTVEPGASIDGEIKSALDSTTDNADTSIATNDNKPDTEETTT